MQTGIALLTVAFLAIWAQDLTKREGAGTWRYVSGVTFTR
jgi:hypothetical protein